jgi:hypothetical protein
LTAATSVAASRSNLPISASTLADNLRRYSCCLLSGAVLATETVLIRPTSESFNPAGLRSTSRSDSRWTSTKTASTAVSFVAAAFASAASSCSPSEPPATRDDRPLDALEIGPASSNQRFGSR